MTTENNPNITMHYSIDSETGKSDVDYSWPYAESDSTPKQRKKLKPVMKKYHAFMDAVNRDSSNVIEGSLEIILTDTGRKREKPKDTWAIPPVGC